MGKYPQSAFLKWECGPTENTAYLSIDYEGGKLNMGAVVSGTPIIGTACAITVNGGNFDVTQIIPVTPAEKYKGKTLEFFVGLTAHKDSVIYAKVGW